METVVRGQTSGWEKMWNNVCGLKCSEENVRSKAYSIVLVPILKGPQWPWVCRMDNGVSVKMNDII